MFIEQEGQEISRLKLTWLTYLQFIAGQVITNNYVDLYPWSSVHIHKLLHIFS